MPPERRSLVEIEGLGHTYARQGSRSVKALDSLDLEVTPGEFAAIVGPSGCGKTTLLNIVAGLLEPTAGSVLIDGRKPKDVVRDSHISFVFQDSVLLPWRTALANARLPLDLAADPKADERARDLMKLVKLEGFEDHYPSELSGGMKSRVSLARALAPSPAIILMDEPFGSLDEITAHELNIELLSLWETSRPSVLLVTHNIAQAVFMADQVIVMSERPGKIVEHVPVNIERPRTDETLTDQRFFDCQRSIRRALRKPGKV